jgi:hypothetical protein
MRLTVPPVRLASMMPEAIDAATPSECVTDCSSPERTAAATAPPIAPQMEVACWPCSKNVEFFASWS